MLGDRGRADPQDRQPDHGHHAGTAAPDRRLRLRRGRRPGAGPAAAARAGPLPVLARGEAHRGQGEGSARRRGGQDRDPGTAAGRGDGAGPPARRRPPAPGRPAWPGPGRNDPMIGRYVSRLTVRNATRAAFRLLRLTAAAALAVAAAPVSLVAAGSAAGAWLRGWPPARLYRAAAFCLPMVIAWLAATAAATRSWRSVAAAPYLAWLAMWRQVAAGSYLDAAAIIAPAAIPLGLLAGGMAWSYRIRSMETGSGGLSPGSAVAFDLRQWRHQVRSARAMIAAPGSLPLTTGNGAIVAGAVIRAVGHQPGRIASIPYRRMRSHQVVIGTTGTGKTTLCYTCIRDQCKCSAIQRTHPHQDQRRARRG